MKTQEKNALNGPVVEPTESKYAGKPLNSEKEASAKKHEKAAENLLKQLGLRK